ncbi:MAG: tRNA (N6-threonylcarbamoyladenosine(37)-N6)-methyltransferase TrmO [Gammaproteobacteria bacterium]|nr:tRNA (N6-threonylcarbamoyladenosine(37)-N6)-methyltransferase TrmO [Gammaproteobacteria bacterium]
MADKTTFEFSPVAYIKSCFKQKFTIPRQPGLVKHAKAELVFLPEYSQEESLRGIEKFSHLWIVFVFHQSIRKNKKTTVRPPRLGGREKRGVFATRSNFRPNPIGQSVVKLDGIEKRGRHYVLHLSGVDLLDGTPVIDVKPYIPYADSIPDAKADFADTAPPPKFKVEFTEQALQQIQDASRKNDKDLKLFIEELLAYDPRPAFYEGEVDKEKFVTQIYDFHLFWLIKDGVVSVLELAEH